jgi:DNA-nicking Smr family endonuclease
VKRRAVEHPAGHKSRTDAAADADAEAFAREMRDVVPLRPDPRGRVRAAPRPSAPPASASRRDDAGESADAFAAPGVDRREIRKLRRGGYPAADSRDLHGMTAAHASAVVHQFIENSRRRGLRCVSIVHGRGLHSEGHAPVLKIRVREYLRSQRAVLAYSDAPRSDGGPGAVYVLLRKSTGH